MRYRSRRRVSRYRPKSYRRRGSVRRRRSARPMRIGYRMY